MVKNEVIRQIYIDSVQRTFATLISKDTSNAASIFIDMLSLKPSKRE